MFEDLIKIEGCSCGRDHELTTKHYIVKPGAIFELQKLSVQIEFTAGGSFCSGKDFAQGRLAGTVLTQKSIDLSAFKVRGHMIQRPGARIVFDDVGT